MQVGQGNDDETEVVGDEMRKRRNGWGIQDAVHAVINIDAKFVQDLSRFFCSRVVQRDDMVRRFACPPFESIERFYRIAQLLTMSPRRDRLNDGLYFEHRAGTHARRQKDRNLAQPNERRF
jgi:hypothetical protein